MRWVSFSRRINEIYTTQVLYCRGEWDCEVQVALLLLLGPWSLNIH